MDNKYIFAFTEEETAIIMQALTFFADGDLNRFLTEEQYDLAQSALSTIEKFMF